MPFDNDSATDRQSQTGSPQFGGEKGIEKKF
jgi:hypothetical protein